MLVKVTDCSGVFFFLVFCFFPGKEMMQIWTAIPRAHRMFPEQNTDIRRHRSAALIENVQMCDKPATHV